MRSWPWRRSWPGAGTPSPGAPEYGETEQRAYYDNYAIYRQLIQDVVNPDETQRHLPGVWDQVRDVLTPWLASRTLCKDRQDAADAVLSAGPYDENLSRLIESSLLRSDAHKTRQALGACTTAVDLEYVIADVFAPEAFCRLVRADANAEPNAFGSAADAGK